MDSGALHRRDRGAFLVLVTGLPGTGKSSIAKVVSSYLQAAVLSHDWTMSALRPYGDIQSVLDQIPAGHRVVGWSILTALAQLQLRQGRSVVLDGVARSDEIDRCKRMTRGEESRFVLISTHCSDRDLHRSRIERRDRQIPNWYELTWDRVEQSLDSWVQPDRVDLHVDAKDAWDENVARVVALFSSLENVNEDSRPVPGSEARTRLDSYGAPVVNFDL